MLVFVSRLAMLGWSIICIVDCVRLLSGVRVSPKGNTFGKWVEFYLIVSLQAPNLLLSGAF